MKSWPKRVPVPARSPARRPWGPQAVGILVLLLSFLIIYHGAEGATLLKELDGYLAGSKPAATEPQVHPTPTQQLSQDLADVARLVPQKNWPEAGSRLAAAEGAWQALASSYAKAGVSPTDLNGLTGDLAEAQMAIAAKDARDALTQVTNARRTLQYMEATVAQGASPSLTEMSALVSDLQAALAKGDMARAKDDAASLATMLSTIQKGF